MRHMVLKRFPELLITKQDLYCQVLTGRANAVLVSRADLGSHIDCGRKIEISPRIYKW